MIRWLVPLTAILTGTAAGLGAFTFGYARGASYLTNEPSACANCHIMSEHYDAWRKSSHAAIAVCNDCHTPHDPVGKYVVKAKNGFWHSFYFTTGTFPDPLRITEPNRRVTEGACRHRHEPITFAIDHAAVAATWGTDPGEPTGTEPIACIRCHANVGHWVR